MLGKGQAGGDSKSEDLPMQPYKKPRAPALVQFPPGDNCAFFVRITPNKGGIFINKSKKTGVALLAILIILVAGALLAYHFLSPDTTVGAKTVTIFIDHLSGEDKTLEIKTDAEFLRGALEQETLIDGENSQYGFFVTSVDGEKADDAKQQWWGYTKSGEYVETGVDQTPIADGDSFEFKLNEGY